MTRHNKKRNTGLLYEFLVRSISDSVIEGDEKRRNTALSIIKKHFTVGSELYKEFRLFNSLAASTVKSSSVADTILEAAKKASSMCDIEKLDYEKSLLIRSINHGLGDGYFYDRKISEYKIYATIQTLLNEWRSGEYSDIVALAQFEEQLKEWLLKEKKSNSLNEETTSFPVRDPLVEKLMIKKINEKYNDSLNEEQANIIRSYIFAKDEVTKNKLVESLELIKTKTLNEIDSYFTVSAGKDKFFDEKLKKAKSLILKENVDSIDDEKIEKFLDISKLGQEIRN